MFRFAEDIQNIMEKILYSDDLSIISMSQSLFKIYESIAVFREHEVNLNPNKSDLPHEINKAEAYALLLAARIDVTICFKNLKLDVGKYEGCFYLNIAFMKMMEIMDTIMDATSKKDNELYYKPNKELSEKVKTNITSWRKCFTKWIKPKRNKSTAHYHPNFCVYMNTGYTEIDPCKNQECFYLFYEVTQNILDLIRPHLIINKECFIDNDEKQLDLNKSII